MHSDNLFPLMDYDPDPTAIIEPSIGCKPANVPEHCVICFFAEVIETIVSQFHARVIASSQSEIGQHPLYEIEYKGRRLAFFHPGIGAPLAVGLLEEMIAFGCRKFIACGGAGVLNAEIALGHLMVPQFAYRDEGTSYHYLPPSQKVEMNPNALKAIIETLESNKLPYILGSTWTTDAIYRETKGKAAKFKEMGVSSVEMEAASFMAVAQFRNVPFGQILYGGDSVIESGWDSRKWNSRADIRQQLFWLAADACFAIKEEDNA
ncbi:MAG: nucleoside phosphorylase [Anaerolineaceae bacterium]|nr:nucleoside phosphorylase [Anaerolineaceae bacterium]